MSNQKFAPTSKRQIFPVLTWAIIVIAILIFISTPIWQSVSLWSNEVFRLSFLGNWAATMLGALVGIPIALALSKWQQNEQDRTQKERQEQERADRERFVLNAIRDELRENRSILEQMIEEQQQREGVTSTMGMREVNWKALSDSGELRWIDNLRILLHISEAYFHISTLTYLERESLALQLAQNTYRGTVIKRVHIVRPDALRYVKDAIRVIDEKIGGDYTFSDGASGSLPKTFEP